MAETAIKIGVFAELTGSLSFMGVKTSIGQIRTDPSL